MPAAPRRLLRALSSSTFRMGDSGSRLPQKEEALPGRSQHVPVADDPLPFCKALLPASQTNSRYREHGERAACSEELY
ncbi:mitochondrial peptide methionine sulfoxide reductase-like [Falco biarmicus]|uniref:mitochondrial peptide methionine sulfoxide reductase-like n=1 Tax=Falco biarmicus TaxID=345155 RepID=UPI0024BD11DC|nr:mitochondrial peptide methionine sulfoxide reductase-like [Falco biarmicus]